MSTLVSGVPFRVLACGLDWVTVTAQTEAQQRKLTILGQDLISREQAEGNKTRDVRAYGYRGVGCGSVSLAGSADRTRLVCSGALAAEAGPQAISLAEASRRIDLQVTVDASDPKSLLGSTWLDLMKMQPTRSGALPLRTRIQSSDDGYSIYCGAPKSDKRLVIYNKYAESPDEYPPGAVRYELRVTDTAAQIYLENLQQKGCAVDRISSLVARHIRSLGLPVTWQHPPAPESLVIYRRTADADRTLAWLKDKVSPSVYWLLEVRGVEEVQEALQIPTKFLGVVKIPTRVSEER